MSFDLPTHGFAPVATVCRPFGTHELAPNRYVEVDSESVGAIIWDASITSNRNVCGTRCSIPSVHSPAMKWRIDVAMGVSPWNENQCENVSPEGATGAIRPQLLSPLRGFACLLIFRSTGLHPWLQYAVPLGLTSLRPIDKWKSLRGSRYVEVDQQKFATW